MRLPRLRPKRPPKQPYPPYVATPEERERWDLAAAIAREIFGDVDEANVWMATRSIYNSEIPTDL